MKRVPGELFSWEVWLEMQVIHSEKFRLRRICENCTSGSRNCTIAPTAQNRCGHKLNSLTSLQCLLEVAQVQMELL